MNYLTSWKILTYNFTLFCSNASYPSREIPWEPNATSLDPVLTAFREENGYTYADIITVPKLYASFWDEHYHGNSTIRYILAGSGFFDLRDADDNWVRMHVKAGDFMEWPAGIYHRFTVDEGNYIHAMRLFKGSPVWNSFPRSEHICTDNSTVRYDYIKSTLSNEDPDAISCVRMPSSSPSEPSVPTPSPSTSKGSKYGKSNKGGKYGKSDKGSKYDKNDKVRKGGKDS